MGRPHHGAERAEHEHHPHHHDQAGDAALVDDDWPIGGRRGRPWPEGSRRRGSRRGPGGGPGGMWFGGPRFGGGRRPRGDVRLAILALLGESPMHGYQMIQEITERSGGRWAPSPGSVYPTLQALEDEGLVVATKSEGKRVFELTDAGRAQLEELGERAQAPWDLGDGDPVGARDLAEQMAQLAGAFKQVIHHGSPAQIAKAGTVLGDARRSLYQILADEDQADTPTT